MLFKIIGIVLAAVILSGETANTDNRSTASDLVRSLYDALNAREYARAYDYFSEPPAKDFATYEKGFENTAHVDVMTGDVTGDGAAGSIFYAVPTLIKSSDKKGGTKVYSGCYTVRQVNGTIQEPPFRPLQIYKGALKPAKDDDFAFKSFPKCGDQADLPATDVTARDAKVLFIAEQEKNCDKVEETRGGLNEPTTYKMKYRGEDAAADEPDREITIFGFLCTRAAYNESFVYYISDGVEALRLLSFAQPHLVITHPAGDDEGKVLKSMTVDGYSSRTELVNSEVDEKTQSITSFNKWRGVGDASSNGTWKLKGGEFVLTDFDADPTFDGEINPITVIENGKLKELK